MVWEDSIVRDEVLVAAKPHNLSAAKEAKKEEARRKRHRRICYLVKRNKAIVGDYY
jgi:hypothetical protein